MMQNDSDSCSEPETQSSSVAGVVIKITVKNFMCHEHLEVNFNRHINFICGKNGSGKSAILTGLVIGLGGKSADTSRGINVRGLIKNGKTQAIIEVTLSNDGSNAYKNEIYGNQLTIIRVISEKSSLYKISGAQGKPVPCKRLELDTILSCFKIQINNPISVLNQEMAKSFIKTSNPKDLYKFFMQSTLLRDCENTVLHSQNVSIPNLGRILREKEDELNFVNKDLEEIKQKHEKKEHLIELQHEFEQLKNEYNWTLVHSACNDVNRLKTRLCEIKENINDLDKKIVDKDGSEKEIQTKKEELTAALNELSQKKDEYVGLVLEAQRNYIKARDRYKALSDERKVLERKLIQENSALKQIDERLKMLDSQNAEAAAKRDRIAAKSESLKKKIHELKTIVNTNVNHKRNLVVSLQKKSEEVSTYEAGVRQMTANIVKIKSRLKDLQSNASELTCFGPYMPKLVEEIDRTAAAGKFEQKPIGPLGYYIKLNDTAKLKDATFGPAIEAIVGKSLLCGFAVHSFKDSQIMNEIFQRVNIRNPPMMVISPFIHKVHDVVKYEVSHPKFSSMLRALDMLHPVVANTIIDQTSLESILLLPTSEDAYSLMEHNNSVLYNCIRAVTPTYVFYPSPNYRSYHLTSKLTTTILQANKDSLIKNLKEELKNSIELEKEKLISFNSVKEEETKIRNLLTQADKEASRINEELVNAEMELINLADEETLTSTEQEMLKDDISFRKNTIEKVQGSLEKTTTDLESVKGEYEKAKQTKTNIESNDCCYDEEISNIQNKLDVLEKTYYELTENFSKIKSRKRDEEIKYEKICSSISKSESDITKKQNLAEMNGEPLEENNCRPKDELKERISVVENEIVVINDFIGTEAIEEITTDLKSRLDKVEEVRNTMKLTEENLSISSQNTEDRRNRFESLRLDKSKKISENFAAITRLRNYKEAIIFDHQARKLNIIVKTDAKNQKSTSVLSLSGGERSYSMVAFILALWQEMALPFYFLDEFDVFMDPLNRDIIIKLLIMHARDNHSQQYVFFTPNDFHLKSTGNDVGIFRMNDPRDDEHSEL